MRESEYQGISKKGVFPSRCSFDIRTHTRFHTHTQMKFASTYTSARGRVLRSVHSMKITCRDQPERFANSLEKHVLHISFHKTPKRVLKEFVVIQLILREIQSYKAVSHRGEKYGLVRSLYTYTHKVNATSFLFMR